MLFYWFVAVRPLDLVYDIRPFFDVPSFVWFPSKFSYSFGPYVSHCDSLGLEGSCSDFKYVLDAWLSDSVLNGQVVKQTSNYEVRAVVGISR